MSGIKKNDNEINSRDIFEKSAGNKKFYPENEPYLTQWRTKFYVRSGLLFRTRWESQIKNSTFKFACVAKLATALTHL